MLEKIFGRVQDCTVFYRSSGNDLEELCFVLILETKLKQNHMLPLGIRFIQLVSKANFAFNFVLEFDKTIWWVFSIHLMNVGCGLHNRCLQALTLRL